MAYKLIKYLLLFLLTTIFQSTVAALLSIWGIKPDLLLLLLFYISLREGPIWGAGWGFVFGFTIDSVYAPLQLGIGSFSKVCLGFLAGNWGGKIYLETPQSKGLFLFSLITVHDILRYGMGKIGNSGLAFWYPFLTKTLPTAAYTAVLGAIVYYLIKRQAKKGYIIGSLWGKEETERGV